MLIQLANSIESCPFLRTELEDLRSFYNGGWTSSNILSTQETHAIPWLIEVRAIYSWLRFFLGPWKPFLHISSVPNNLLAPVQTDIFPFSQKFGYFATFLKYFLDVLDVPPSFNYILKYSQRKSRHTFAK